MNLAGVGLALVALCIASLPSTEGYLAMDIIKVIQLATSSVYHTWGLVESKIQPKPGSPYYQEKILPEEYYMNSSPVLFAKKDEHILLAKIYEVNRKIANIEERLRRHDQNVMRQLESMPQAIMTDLKVNQVLDIVKNIEALHERFVEYTKKGFKDKVGDKKPGLERLTITSFAKFVTDHQPTTPLSIMDKIHALLVPHMDSDKLLGSHSFFYTFRDYIMNAQHFSCDVKQSPQQLLYNMYVTFQLTQLKAYTMVHFSWELLRLYDQGNFTLEAELLKTSYLQRMAQQAMAIKTVMKDCRNDYWECDPKDHVEGKTYTKLTRFLQGYIVNEVDLNTENTCRENCAFYKFAKQSGCFSDQFCARQPTCRGNIVGCKFVDSDMTVCQSGLFADRRYDWIEYENGRALGQRKACRRAPQKVDSWWRYLFWHCSYCFCYCDDPNDSKTERYFSLRPATVDTAKNKVVTGLRLIKINKIIHLQVQQAELLPHADINETTVEWVPVKEFGIKDKDVQVGRDYHMLTWEARAIDLDDIKLPAGQVMTGLKLRRIGGHLNLEVQGNQFNYTTGKLTHNGSKSQWFGNDNTDGNIAHPRTPHILNNPDSPDKTTGLNKIDSEPDTFIEFTSSDADLDAGQTAVPFIDIQTVAPKPPVALVGAGIFHKGRSYSGGYIAAKVFTYDHAIHEQDVFPDLNEADF